MANTASEIATDATETVRQAGSGVIDRITSNPLPAAMVGLGVGWLLLSGRKGSNGASYSNGSSYRMGAGHDRPLGYDRSLGYDAQSGGPGAIDKAQQRVGEIADGVERKVGHAADQVGELAGQVPYQVRSTADDLSRSASRMFESNPLAVGAIAVAVGAAVGLAMPATEMERSKLAQPAREALGKVEEAASGALEQVEQQAHDVEQQALDEDRQARAN